MRPNPPVNLTPNGIRQSAGKVSCAHSSSPSSSHISSLIVSVNISPSSIVSKPALACHFDFGMDLACVPVVVSNMSSYKQWNCGDTRPVSRFNIKDTLCACLGEYPRLIPILVLSVHFCAFLPSCSSFFIHLCQNCTKTTDNFVCSC